MNNLNKKQSSIMIEDKRDFILSSLSIKDNYTKKVIDACDLFIKSVDDIYDSIIINKEVTIEVNEYLKSINNFIDKLMEDLYE